MRRFPDGFLFGVATSGHQTEGDNTSDTWFLEHVTPTVLAERSGRAPSAGAVIDPTSLGGAVRYAYQVSGVPVFVTEHGVGVDDDALRADFIEPSLAGLLDAIDDGVPVLGYCHWTLLDNLEWAAGYRFHFGLHTVDRETFARTPKPSTARYAAVATSRALP
ncbi:MULTISPECIES: family 1 glycosylhydrolase [unclassified Micromonospora]|uniref:family 1 glycosylhydrolase n=1 Tax=unclassified Micromonospora TaxID=2617518 RepID=UPI003A8490D2